MTLEAGHELAEVAREVDFEAWTMLPNAHPLLSGEALTGHGWPWHFELDGIFGKHTHMMHGAGIFTKIYPKKYSVLYRSIYHTWSIWNIDVSLV